MIETSSLQSLIEHAVEELPLPARLPGLYDPIRYTMEGGGKKRLRPLLLLASCQAFGVSPEEAVNQAVGVGDVS